MDADRNNKNIIRGFVDYKIEPGSVFLVLIELDDLAIIIKAFTKVLHYFPFGQASTTSGFLKRIVLLVVYDNPLFGLVSKPT